MVLESSSESLPAMAYCSEPGCTWEFHPNNQWEGARSVTEAAKTHARCNPGHVACKTEEKIQRFWATIDGAMNQSEAS